MLKNKVRETLIETREKKEKVLIEEKLIENRVLMLFGDIKTIDDFKSLSEKKQLNLSVKFIQEMSFLEENGLIVEQDWGSLLNKIFGGAFGSITQTMVEPFINSILSGLGFKEGFIKNFLISFLTSRPSDIIKAFSDCKIMARLVGEGIVEAMVMTMQRNSGYGGFGYDLIRNQLGNILESNEFLKGIEDGLTGTICSIVSKLTKNTANVVDKLKGSSPTTAAVS